MIFESLRLVILVHAYTLLIFIRLQLCQHTLPSALLCHLGTTIAWDSSLNEQSQGSLWLPCVHNQVANYYIYNKTGKTIS